MGILDTLTGMRGGPLGGGGFSGGGMSPITMGILGLLAYKAVKGLSASSGAVAGAPASGGAEGNGSGTGGLSDLLKNLGGGGAAGGGLGGILSSGLGDLLKQFQGAGHGDAAHSWVDTGANKPITPNDLGKVLTPDQIAFLTERTGLSKDALLSGLSQHLPNAIDALTPAGRAPTGEELARVV